LTPRAASAQAASRRRPASVLASCSAIRATAFGSAASAARAVTASCFTASFLSFSAALNTSSDASFVTR
jgi:hypothetical protein